MSDNNTSGYPNLVETSKILQSTQYLNGTKFDEALENAKTYGELEEIKRKLYPFDDKRHQIVNQKQDEICLNESKNCKKERLKNLFYLTHDNTAREIILTRWADKAENLEQDMDEIIGLLSTEMGYPTRMKVMKRIIQIGNKKSE